MVASPVTDTSQLLDSYFGPVKHKWKNLFNYHITANGIKNYVAKYEFVDLLRKWYLPCRLPKVSS